jgi:SMI1/KNR4 family protein SUKH-1
LPAEYVKFLEQMNGGEGFIGENYLMAWPVQDLVQSNKDYLVEEAAPELFLFGSNGGGEAFAFDTRSFPPPIVGVPLIVISLEDAVRLAPDFDALLHTCIGRNRSFLRPIEPGPGARSESEPPSPPRLPTAP